MDKIKNFFKNIDKLDLKIMRCGLKFCFLILVFSILLLISYLTFSNNLFIYNLGLSLFKLSTYFGIEFIICGIVVDSIKQSLT